MKREVLKRLVPAALAVLTAFGITACGGSRQPAEKPKTVVRIAYNSSLYGDGWINALSAEFEKENPSIDIQLMAEPDIDHRIGFQLESGMKLPDIAFLSRTNWQSWAASGLLSDLGGVYDAEVEGKAYSEKLPFDIRKAGMFSGRYYTVPWGGGVTGLIYNEDLFAQNGWNVPTTLSELNALIGNIRKTDVSPFAWSAQNMQYWDQIVDTWWAQGEGIDGMHSYLKMDTPKVYSQQGRLIALEAFQSIVADPDNSDGNPLEMSPQKAVSEFLNKNAALMPGGYLTDILSKSKSAKFKIGMMRLPGEGKELNTAVSIDRNIALIPSAAAEKSAALKFLAFMAKDDMQKIFMEKTGLPGPFLYTQREDSKLNTLAEDELYLWKNCEIVDLHSDNPLYYNTFFDWPLSGSPLMQIYLGNTTALKAFEENAQYASENWPKS